MARGSVFSDLMLCCGRGMHAVGRTARMSAAMCHLLMLCGREAELVTDLSMARIACRESFW